MKIYLASRYSRRLELCGYREQLEAMGHTVTSRWLNGQHQIGDEGNPIGENGEALVEGDNGSASIRAALMRQKFAAEDAEDVAAADMLIAFTEPPRSSASRGGRHVELGMAIALKKIVLVVGHRENIFCWVPEVDFYDDWQSAKVAIEHDDWPENDYRPERVITVRMPIALHRELIQQSHANETSLNRYCIDRLRGTR